MKTRPDKPARRLLKSRYRLILLNDNTMHRVLSTRMTKWRLAAWTVAGIVLLGFIGIFLIVSTPLKSFLPGYLYTYERDDVMNATIKLDSLGNQVATQNAFIDNLMAILNDQVDTVLPQLEEAPRPNISIDSIITASELERDYVKQYDNNQRFNLSVLSPLAAQGIIFVNPLQGAEARFPEEGEDARRITFDMPRLQPVSAAYRGTVLDVYNTLDGAFTVIVQHPNDFISRYSGLTQTMVKRGETVQPGARLGLIEREKAETYGITPTFELWYKGSAVNPREYVPF